MSYVTTLPGEKNITDIDLFRKNVESGLSKVQNKSTNPTYELIYLKYILDILSVLRVTPVDDRTIYTTIESSIKNPDFTEMQIALSEAVRRGIVHPSNEKNKFGDILYIIHQ